MEKRINEVVEEFLNRQIAIEYEAAQIYLAASFWCELKGINGCAKFFRKQYYEELVHMQKVCDYMLDRSALPKLPAMKAPVREWDGMLDVLNTALDHERKVSESWEMANQVFEKENDKSTYQFSLWYLEEQVEEEATVQSFIDRLSAFGASSEVQMMLDKEICCLADESDYAVPTE